MVSLKRGSPRLKDFHVCQNPPLSYRLELSIGCRVMPLYNTSDYIICFDIIIKVVPRSFRPLIGLGAFFIFMSYL